MIICHVGPPWSQQGGLRLEGIHSLHLALSGTATFGIVAGLLIFCYLKRKKIGCRNSSSQPATPSAPALQSPVPEQLPQSLRLPQKQMFSQRNSTQKTNFESVHGHQDSSDFQLA